MIEDRETYISILACGTNRNWKLKEMLLKTHLIEDDMMKHDVSS